MSVRYEAEGARVAAPGAGRRAVPSERRTAALTAVALGLLAVVGVASSASAWHPARAAAGAPDAVLKALASVGGVVLVVALLVLWIEAPVAGPLRRARRAPAGDELDEFGTSIWTAGKTMAVVLLAVAVICIAAVPLLSRTPSPSQGPTSAERSAPAVSLRSESRRAADPANLGWLLLPIAVTLVMLAPAAALVRRRRLARDQAAHAEEPAVGRAVQASIAALESERDPRRAILRAYAQMEKAFRSVAIERGRDETASEFLGRTMRRLRVSADAAAALTHRFEEVRYGAHDVTEADRAEALDALWRIERELAERR